MRQETERLAPPARPLPELDAEQEIDFRRYWSAVVARWWLVVAAVAVGALIGYLLSFGGGTLYRAKATVYLGQPVSPTGSGAFQSLAANPSAVSQIVRSESVIERTAAKVGLPPAKLRGNVSTSSVSGAITKQGQTPLVEVTVRGAARAKTAEAANLLAAAVVDGVSGYVDGKIDGLEEKLGAQDHELAGIDRRIDTFERSLSTGGSLSSAERLTLLSVIGFAEQRRGDLVAERSSVLQLLSFAQNVERGRVVTPAAAVKVDARSGRSSVLVGALIGLIVGVALALLWEPLLRRRDVR